MIGKDGWHLNEQEPVTVMGAPVEFINTNVKPDPFGKANGKYLNILPAKQDTGPKVRKSLAVDHT